MRFEEWRPLYLKIISELGIDEEADRRSAFLLSSLIPPSRCAINSLRKKLLGRFAIVYGAGPSIKDDLKELTEVGLHRGCINIAANGATKALLESGLTPDVIVTDLDGDLASIKLSNERQSIAVVHAHGDNVEVITEFVPQLGGRLVGSTQAEPVPPCVYCFGGFTDGDRGVYLAEEMGARAVILAGMDFGTVVGKYSKDKDMDNNEVRRKLMKLRVGRNLIEELVKRRNITVLNVTKAGEDIRGVKRVKPREVRKMLESGI